MTVREFISKYKIKSTLAAGLKSHLHAEDTTDLSETDLIVQYKDFSGVQLQSDPVDVRNTNLRSLPADANPSVVADDASIKKEKTK